MGQVVKAKVVLVDIEGTISSQSYVLEVLYPYSRIRFEAWLAEHAGTAEAEAIIAETRLLSGHDDVIRALEEWQDADLKKPPLKKLQGLIWDSGYAEGAFKGHLYEDAFTALSAWKARGLPVYVFSSGSIKAQTQFFENSQFGDARPLFAGHFDTDIGAKVEAGSYRRIAEALKLAPGELVFFSDNPKELAAATAAGLQIVHVLREDTVSVPHYAEIRSFAEVAIS